MSKSDIIIEIIAVGLKKIYSAGKICITPKGDVYYAYKLRNDKGSHISRHRDGTLWMSGQDKVQIRKLKNISDFSGLEFIGTHGFGLNSLPLIYEEYKLKKSDGIFAIDMRNYEDGRFNLNIAIFTEEGLPKLLNSFKWGHKKQFYLYTDCNPKIAIVALEVKKN